MAPRTVDQLSEFTPATLRGAPSPALAMARPGAAGAIEIDDARDTLPAVGVGVIGYGYWGPNLARVFAEVAGGRLVAVSDMRPSRLAQARARHPSAKMIADYRDLLADPSVEAVAIATPVSSHYHLATQALQAGKHVLVEKPIAATSDQAARLVDTAAQLGRVLMVDHTFLYTAAVRKIHQLVAAGHLGQLYYYDSVRINLGLFQRDVDVLWDLAVHDLSIMDYVLGAQPVAISASGIAHVPGHPTDLAYLTCFFENNVLGHLHVSWLAPVKIRRTLIGGDRSMIVYDDLEPSEKVKVYDKGIVVNNEENGHVSGYQMMVDYRVGDMWAPHLELVEGLQVEALHFLDCIRHGRTPLSDGTVGLRMIRILEAASRSLSQHGRPVQVT